MRPTLAEALPPGVEAGDVLLQLKADYSKRGVQLVELAGKWRFQTAPDLAFCSRRRGSSRGRCRAQPSRRWPSSPIASR